MNDLPVRKRLRLQGYDYSKNGAYFITICTENREDLLARVVGAAHPGGPSSKLTNIGLIVKQFAETINNAYPDVRLDKYVIMPNHIHMVLIIETVGNKLSRCVNGPPGCAAPTKELIPKVINAFKSLTTRHCGGYIWQRSYHERIIRSEAEYKKICRYIDENPARWQNDRYYR